MAGLAQNQARTIDLLEETTLPFVSLLAGHRPRALGGQSLGAAVSIPSRAPQRLSALYEHWLTRPELMRAAAPTLVFAVFGQARATGRLSPEREDRLLSALITQWALQSTPGGAAAIAASGHAGARDIRQHVRTMPRLIPAT